MYNAPLEQGLKRRKQHGFGYGVYANMSLAEIISGAILDGATAEEILECVTREQYEQGLAYANDRNQTEDEK